jgi:hypothetical protein
MRDACLSLIIILLLLLLPAALGTILGLSLADTPANQAFIAAYLSGIAGCGLLALIGKAIS